MGVEEGAEGVGGEEFCQNWGSSRSLLLPSLPQLWRQERVESNERFQQLLREFREDSARREATTQQAFKDIRTVGLSIVKTLNHHTRILERIEQRLGTRGTGSRGRGNGRSG